MRGQEDDRFNPYSNDSSGLIHHTKIILQILRIQKLFNALKKPQQTQIILIPILKIQALDQLEIK